MTCLDSHEAGDTVNLAHWNVIEANVTILCACLIASKPVFSVLIPDKLFSRMGSYFSRASGTQRNAITALRQTAPKKGGSDSRHYLPMNSASFEIPTITDFLHSEGTKTSQEAKNSILSDESHSPIRPVYGATAV